MEIRDLIFPKYKETFPEDLLPAFLRYASELAGGVHDYLDSEMFEDDYSVWMDFDLTLHRSLLEELPAEVLQMDTFQAYETFGECEVLSYKMIKWLEENVTDYDSLPLKMLSIINLSLIQKDDAITVEIDKENECLTIGCDTLILQKEIEGSQGYFTWPKELLPLYEK